MSYSLLIGSVLLCAQICYAADSSCSATTCEVQVTIDSGPVCGRVLLAENSVSYYSFRGIPYAKPPTGSRRFKAPETVDSWTEPLYATEEGPACPQRDVFYGNLVLQPRGQSEDCLYANVHVPATADLTGATTGLPVLVFIHGGAFTSGSGNSDYYGPEYLVYKEVIVITFNYRLGVFGFLSLNTADVPGNAGMWDQVALLKWVKRNVASFGGNPDDITLMGQSAGAASVQLHTLSEASEGLFNRTILLSGTAVQSFFSASPAYAQYANSLLFSHLGLDSSDTTALYEQLVDMPVYKLLYAAEKVQYDTVIGTFVPIVEDESTGVTRFLTADPMELIGQGRGKDYPTILSFTTDEAETFRYVIVIFDLIRRVGAAPYMALPPRLLFNLTSDELATASQKIQERYYSANVTEEALVDFLTDSFFNYVAFKLAEWRSVLGGASLYFHQFSYDTVNSSLKYGLCIDYEGAAHAEDLTYILRPKSALQDYVSFPATTDDDKMKDWMTDFVINFVKCSNPTCMDDAESPWPPVSSGSIQYQNSAGPAYDLREMTTEQKEMVEWFDTIDTQAKAMSDQLSCSR